MADQPMTPAEIAAALREQATTLQTELAKAKPPFPWGMFTVATATADHMLKAADALAALDAQATWKFGNDGHQGTTHAALRTPKQALAALDAPPLLVIEEEVPRRESEHILRANLWELYEADPIDAPSSPCAGVDVPNAWGLGGFGVKHCPGCRGTADKETPDER